MVNQNQFQKGEDIFFVLKNNNGFDLNDVYPLNAGKPAKFVVHLYPDGLDLSLSDNKAKIKEIRYDSDKRQVGSEYYGYVEPVNAGSEETPDITSATCILPWQLTKGMDAGKYTMSILWEQDNSRTIMTNNSLIVMVEGSGEYTDSNLDIQ